MAFGLDANIFNRANSDRRADEQMAMNRRSEERNVQKDEFAMGNARVNQAVKYLGMATPENWQAIRSHAISSGLGNESTLPTEYDADWIARTRNAFSGKSSSVPSSVQEYEYFQGLPEDKKPAFMDLKRKQYLNLGNRFFNPYSGQSLLKGVTPDASPANKAAQAQAIADVELVTKPATAAAVGTAKVKAAQGSAKAKRVRDSAITGLDKIDDDLTAILDSGALSKVVGSPYATLLPNMPGGEAADVDALIEGLKDKLSIAAISDMRASSPNGGAVGQVTEGEWDKLANTFVSLKKSQSVEQFQSRLNDLRSQIASMREMADAGYVPLKLTDSPNAAPALERVRRQHKAIAPPA